MSDNLNIVKEKPKEKIYEDSIINWPEDERPRERLLKHGPHIS